MRRVADKRHSAPRSDPAPLRHLTCTSTILINPQADPSRWRGRRHRQHPPLGLMLHAGVWDFSLQAASSRSAVGLACLNVFACHLDIGPLLTQWAIPQPCQPQEGRQRYPGCPGPSQQVTTQACPVGQVLFCPHGVLHVVDTAQKRTPSWACRVQMHPGELLQATCC